MRSLELSQNSATLSSHLRHSQRGDNRKSTEFAAKILHPLNKLHQCIVHRSKNVMCDLCCGCRSNWFNVNNRQSGDIHGAVAATVSAISCSDNFTMYSPRKTPMSHAAMTLCSAVACLNDMDSCLLFNSSKTDHLYPNG